jgi:23S rRNA (adenine2030-N6)-methyltransferase
LLSYRHSFHAGNFADVLKHCVCTHVFEHLLKKNKPFDYIDTHSGAGLFDLTGADANKLQEFTKGIHRIQSSKLPELRSYLNAVKAFNQASTTKNIKFYPGSPALAAYFLRSNDKAHLHELHPKDAKLLSINIKDLKGIMGHKSQIRVEVSDGLKNLQALVPPLSRRAFVLIDPSYEVKTEYDDVFFAVEKAYKKFPTGTYAIWYTVVERSRIERLERKLGNSAIKNIQRFELGIAPDSDAQGMTSAGLFVINPPWTLFDSMSQLLPKLAPLLANKELANKELANAATTKEELAGQTLAGEDLQGGRSSKALDRENFNTKNSTTAYYKCDVIKPE